ncbi:MAG: hypothetical protein HXX12_06575 [Geothrix sp.]|uniref:hypothetical protein n=1 Tax=Geothrix sp. TaxID=1962974 RepID=UPI001826B6B4|nr:hypothetical protein [Geothrix sp.]NWJ40620.1 hypothetical protein [Geothrix sp.]WIL21380.1 MAG: hypothetical protein QOZ81_000639 [Geothrix sp.]
MRPLALFLTVIVCHIGSCGETETRVIKGKAVAIHWFQVPMNGVCSTDILLQVSLGANQKPEFVRVSVSIPEADFDRWLSALPGLTQFTLVRVPANDSILIESVPIIEEGPNSASRRPGKAPLWRFLKGSEGIALPYGVSIKAFRSTLWPEIPVV